MRRSIIMVCCLAVAMALCGGPHLAAAEEQQERSKAEDQKKGEKGVKEENKEGNLRDGINRAFDELKKDTVQGRKNLNDLYDRSKSPSGDEKTK